MIRRAAAFVLSVAFCYTLATIFATQSVLASLAGLGIPVTPSQRLSATAHDLLGMASLFLPLIAVALLIAFLVAGLLLRWRPGGRGLLYVLAGALALVALHVSLKLSFDITPIAAARTYAGLALQSMAGAVGGYAFARLSSPG